MHFEKQNDKRKQAKERVGDERKKEGGIRGRGRRKVGEEEEEREGKQNEIGSLFLGAFKRSKKREPKKTID